MKLDGSVIWHRLKRRLGIIDDGILEGKSILSEIRPVTVVDELLKTYSIEYASHDLTPASAFQEYFTVPQGERWAVTAWHKAATTGNSRVVINYLEDAVNFNCTAMVTAESSELSLNLVLNQGDMMGMLSTGNGADGAIGLRIMVEKEKAW